MRSASARGILAGILYALILVFPSELIIEGHQVSFFWLGSGLAIGLVLNLGLGPLVGIFLVNAIALYRLDLPATAAVIASVGLALQAYFGAWLFRGPLHGDRTLRAREDLFKFILAGVVAAPMVSATIGTLAWASHGVVPWHEAHSTWISWWFGESVGILFVGPLLFGGIGPLLRAFQRRRAEATVVLVCFVSVCTAVFYADPNISAAFRAPLAILPLPLLFWSAIRLGIPHASLLLLAMGIIVTLGARAGYGPLGYVDTATEMIVLWTYAELTGLTTLLLGSITGERDHAQRALRESEDRFRNLVECGPSVVYIIGHHDLMTLLYISPQAEEVLGFTPAECMQRPGLLAERIHPEDLADVAQRVQAAWQTKRPMNMEYRSIHRDGSVRWIRDESRYLPSQQGEPAHWQGILIDVTSHREIAEQHRKSEELLNGIWATSVHGLFVLNTKGQVLMANPSASKIMGFGRDELTGAFYNEASWQCETPDGRLLHEHEYPFNIVMNTQAPLGGYVHAITNGQGLRRVLSIDGAPLRDAAGRLSGAYFVVEDITSAHEAERRLQSSEARLATIVGSANDAIITIDDQQNITLFNPAAEQIFGFQRQEVLGMPLSLLLPQAPGVQELAPQGAPLGLARNRSTTARRASGEEFPVEVSASRAESSGRTLYTVILRDVSERVRAEEERQSLEAQLRQAQKIEAVGQLAGGVAHDFNNLLQVMQGYTRLAIDEQADADMRNSHLDNVCAAIDKAASLTAQLLAFGRRQSLEKVDCDLNELVQDHLKMVRRLIGEHIAISFVPGPGLGNVRVDRSQIEQVLLNLCLNARDAMPNGGRLVLELRNVQIDDAYRQAHPWARTGRYVLLIVSDTGIGMDTEVQAKIYEPFFTTKPLGQGTGLGLSVVHGIVQQHGGLIHADSVAGQGTSFQIFLPNVERSVSAAGQRLASTVHSGKGTVLLAEDEPGVREIAIKLLERAGYEVIAAENGAIALDLFRRHADTLTLVVLDVVMPQMGGFEAYAAMRALRSEIPTIFSSGYSGSALSNGGELPTGGYFLHKPYNYEQLLNKIAEALGGTSAKG